MPLKDDLLNINSNIIVITANKAIKSIDSLILFILSARIKEKYVKNRILESGIPKIGMGMGRIEKNITSKTFITWPFRKKKERTSK